LATHFPFFISCPLVHLVSPVLDLSAVPVVDLAAVPVVDLAAVVLDLAAVEEEEEAGAAA
jgi:hypothetical protein